MGQTGKTLIGTVGKSAVKAVAQDTLVGAASSKAGSLVMNLTGDANLSRLAGLGTGILSGSKTGKALNSIDSAVSSSVKTLNHIDDVADVSKIVDDVADVSKVTDNGVSPVIYGSEDIANYEYNMIENPGPLAEITDNPAKNFYGGRYNKEVLKEDRIYYRGGNSNNPLGQWFTREPPESVVKVRIDTAVKPQWIDLATGELLGESVIDTAYAIKIPKGTTVYEGPVGSQGGVYCGGFDKMQTFIETPWKINGIEIISKDILL